MTFHWGEILTGGKTVRYAATCDHCGEISRARGPFTKIRGYEFEQGTFDQQYVKIAAAQSHDLEWLPQVGLAPAVGDVPDHIARAAREAYSSASVGNHMAAILMARTVIEATAKEKGISSGTLASKINLLRDQQHIRPAIAEQAHEVRFAGNDMAHGDIDVSPEPADSEEILALMAEVLAEVFQGPARMARIRAKRQAATA